MKVVTTLTIEKEQLIEVKNKAYELRISKSEFIRQAIQKYIDDLKK